LRPVVEPLSATAKKRRKAGQPPPPSQFAFFTLL
jgi:hypothetical protein